MFPSESACTLTFPVTDAKIFSVVHSFQALKSPGPDGLHPLFFQKCWPQIKQSVLALCKNIFKEGQIPLELNKTFICLIPKIQSPSTTSHFRPFSLCNTIYKVISKLIVNRIKPFLDQLIHPSQSAFQKNHRASDNAIIVQEILRHFRKSIQV